MQRDGSDMRSLPSRCISSLTLMQQENEENIFLARFLRFCFKYQKYCCTFARLNSTKT